MNKPQHLDHEHKAISRRNLSFRLILASGIIGVPGAAIPFFLANPNYHDPFVFRIYVASLAALILFLIFIKLIKPTQESTFSTVWLFATGLWTSWLYYANSFAGDYTFGVFLFFILAVAVSYQHVWEPFLLLTTIVITYILAAIFVVDPQTSPLVFLGLIGMGYFLSLFVAINRIKLEKELLKNQLLFSNIFDHSSDILMLINPKDFTVIMHNKKVTTFFNVNLSEKTAIKNLAKFFITTSVASKITTTLKNTSSIEIHHKYIKENRHYWFNIVISTISIEKQTLLLLRATDVTSAIDEKNSANTQAHEVNKMNAIMVGREIKMMELKQKIKELENRINQPIRLPKTD